MSTVVENSFSGDLVGHVDQPISIEPAIAVAAEPSAVECQTKAVTVAQVDSVKTHPRIEIKTKPAVLNAAVAPPKRGFTSINPSNELPLAPGPINGKLQVDNREKRKCHHCHDRGHVVKDCKVPKCPCGIIGHLPERCKRQGKPQERSRKKTAPNKDALVAAALNQDHQKQLGELDAKKAVISEQIEDLKELRASGGSIPPSAKADKPPPGPPLVDNGTAREIIQDAPNELKFMSKVVVPVYCLTDAGRQALKTAIWKYVLWQYIQAFFFFMVALYCINFFSRGIVMTVFRQITGLFPSIIPSIVPNPDGIWTLVGGGSVQSVFRLCVSIGLQLILIAGNMILYTFGRDLVGQIWIEVYLGLFLLFSFITWLKIRTTVDVWHYYSKFQKYAHLTPENSEQFRPFLEYFFLEPYFWLPWFLFNIKIYRPGALVPPKDDPFLYGLSYKKYDWDSKSLEWKKSPVEKNNRKLFIWRDLPIRKKVAFADLKAPSDLYQADVRSTSMSLTKIVHDDPILGEFVYAEHAMLPTSSYCITQFTSGWLQYSNNLLMELADPTIVNPFESDDTIKFRLNRKIQNTHSVNVSKFDILSGHSTHANSAFLANFLYEKVSSRLLFQGFQRNQVQL